MERISWALYDVANSAFSLVMITAVFPLYFAGVIAENESPGDADALWGMAIAGAMAVVAVTSPLVGVLADRRRWRKRLLAVYVAVGVLATAGTAWLEPGDVGLALGLLILADIAFEGGLIFYDALLPGLVGAKTVGRWSGMGWGLGYLGSMVCLILCLPWVEAGRFDWVFLLVALWWLVWSLPLFMAVPDRSPPAPVSTESVFSQLANTWRRIRANRPLFRFFMAYFLYNDGIATTIAFAALYASQTLGFSAPDTLKLLVVVQLSAAFGAFGLGALSDRLGHARVIVATLYVWCAVILAAVLVTSEEAFWVVALIVGFVMGATQSASRGLLASIVPAEEAGELFGFKAVAGRFSAVLGPLVFGWISATTGSQRIALATIGLFFVAGLYLLRGFREEDARAGFVH
jgi:UMF1 family MFS transporter